MARSYEAIPPHGLSGGSPLLQAHGGPAAVILTGPLFDRVAGSPVKAWDGASWQQGELLRWNGHAWEPARIARYTGTGWARL
jgi:hypothetical protein